MAMRSTARKKTIMLDQKLINRARRALGAKTETETIILALKTVAQRDSQIHGLRALAAMGPLDASLIG